MSEAAVPTAPPAGFPPVVVSEVFAERPDGAFGSGTVTNGRLVVEVAAAGGVNGVAVHPRSLRDVVIDVALTTAAAGDDDLVGIYLRQSDGSRYIVCGVSPSGQVGLFATDGQLRKPMVTGRLAPDLPFNPGVGARNRFTVVACGPSLTFLLNNAVVAGANVDARYQEGHAGVMVANATGAAPTRAEVEWVQVRAVLPEQEG